MTTTIKAYTVNATDSLFQNCTTLTTIDCNNTSWSNNSMCNAFYGCTNLVTITNIVPGITNLTNTYRECTNLASFPSIPNTATTLFGTFYGCSNLKTSPTIPVSVTNMDYTYMNCSNLTTIPKIPDTITYLNSTFNGCTNLTYTTGLPNSLTSLTDTFRNCKSLVNDVLVPYSVSSLVRTFEDCTSIVNMPTIPGSVQTVYETFKGCTNLKTATIFSTNVTNIANAFQNCTSLTGDIHFYSENLTNATNSFINTSANKDVYIPFRYMNGANTKTYNAFVAAGYDTSRTKNGVKLIAEDLATFTIVPNPSNAKVTLLAESGIQSGNTITVKLGTKVSWTVSLYGYAEQSSSRTLTANYTQNVTLSKLKYTYTINPTPENATVTLTASGYTQSGNSITVPYLTEVSWSVAAEHYITQTGTKTITETSAENKVLNKVQVSYYIDATPTDALVQITADGYAQIANGITVPYGTEVNYTVSKDKYITQTGTKTLTETTTDTINLSLELFTYTIAPYPEDATVTLKAYNITMQTYQSTAITWTRIWSYDIGSAAHPYCWIGLVNGGTEYIWTDTSEPEVGDVTYEESDSATSSYTISSISKTEGAKQVGNSISVAYNVPVDWTVEKDDYLSQSGTKTVTSTSSEEIVLSQWATWTQPVLTSNTGSTEVQTTASAGSGSAWKVFNPSGYWCSGNGTYGGQTFKATIARTLRISTIAISGLYSDSQYRAKEFTVNGVTKTCTGKNDMLKTFTFDPPWETDVIRIYCTGKKAEGYGWTGIQNLKITAEYKVSSK